MKNKRRLFKNRLLLGSRYTNQIPLTIKPYPVERAGIEPTLLAAACAPLHYRPVCQRLPDWLRRKALVDTRNPYIYFKELVSREGAGLSRLSGCAFSQTLTGFTVRRFWFRPLCYPSIPSTHCHRIAPVVDRARSLMASRPVGIYINLSRMSSVFPYAFQILSLVTHTAVPYGALLRRQGSNLRPSDYEPDELPLLYFAMLSRQFSGTGNSAKT